jgi:two-component sensor histidine kinase
VLLSTLAPNNVKCINGLCIPLSSVDESSSNQFISFFTGLFDTKSWPARWYCGTWSGFQGWLFVISDVITALSYFGIPIFFLFFLSKNGRNRSPFSQLLSLFSFFIMFCGITHALDAIMFWYPMYNALGLVKILTAAVSFTTFVASTIESKRLFNLKTPAELEKIIKQRTEELKWVNEQLNLEIEQRVIYEKDLEESIKRNDQLFVELNHRTKNNLQMVINLLALKNITHGSGDNSGWIRDIQHRIKNMSYVHDQMLRSASVSTIDASHYFTRIIDAVASSFSNKNNTELIIDVSSELRLNSTQATNLGLMVSEIVTNSFKYAFEGVTNPTIKFSVTLNDNKKINFCIEDNGNGFDTSQEKEGSFGQQLISSFASNLESELILTSSEAGTRYELIFDQDKGIHY